MKQKRPLFRLLNGPAWCLAAAATFACYAGDAPRSGYLLVDSAGVQISESTEPLWGEGEGWWIAEHPRVEIGVREGDDPYLFDRIMGVTLTESQHIVVANHGDCSLRYYDATGLFLRTVAGCGEGPGEFVGLWGLYRAANAIYGSQFAEDGPIHVYSEDGQLLRSLSLPSDPSVVISTLYGVFSDGSLLMLHENRARAAAPGFYPRTCDLLRVTQAGTVDTLALLPFSRSIWFQTGIGGLQQFGPVLMVHASEDHLYYGFPDGYEIGIMRLDGKLVGKVRRDWTPIPITDEDRSRFRQQLTGEAESASPGMRAPLLDIANNMVFPDHHPAHHRIMVDQTGHLWVQKTNPRRDRYFQLTPPVDPEPSEWDVFDPGGVWLGVVTTPARFRLYEVGADYVAGVFNDDVEVEYVRVYDLWKQ